MTTTMPEKPQGWLAFRKKGWKGLIARRKQERKAALRRASSSLSSSSSSSNSNALLAASATGFGSSGGFGAAGAGGASGSVPRVLGMAELATASAREVSHGVWQVSVCVIA